MTPQRLLPLILLIVAAGCSTDAADPTLPAQAQSTVAVPAAGMDEIPAMPDDPGCVHLNATLFGQHEKTPVKGWVGNALVSFNGGAPESATFLDQGNKNKVDPNKLDEVMANERFWGTETLTLTFPDGTFTEDASYVGVPESTPDLYVLHETGTLSGTGRFDGASGHITVKGPFLNPFYVATPPWTGTMRGWICM